MHTTCTLRDAVLLTIRDAMSQPALDHQRLAPYVSAVLDELLLAEDAVLAADTLCHALAYIQCCERRHIFSSRTPERSPLWTSTYHAWMDGLIRYAKTISEEDKAILVSMRDGTASPGCLADRAQAARQRIERTGI